MIPKEIQVNKTDVPPILIIGKVKPVTGTKFTDTAILINAWITKLALKPIANIAPNALGLFVMSRVTRNTNKTYKPIINSPPMMPYSSQMMA